jgi:hypothetical protein
MLLLNNNFSCKSDGIREMNYQRRPECSSARLQRRVETRPVAVMMPTGVITENASALMKHP